MDIKPIISTNSDSELPTNPKLQLEEKMLKYVFENAKKGDAESVLKVIDKFCWMKGNWMPFIGN